MGIESETWKRIIDSIGGVKTVFAFLVLATIILGITLIRVAPNLNGAWSDSRLWFCILLIIGIFVIAVVILQLMKIDPRRLMSPTVEHTTIEDSEAVPIEGSTTDSGQRPSD